MVKHIRITRAASVILEKHRVTRSAASGFLPHQQLSAKASLSFSREDSSLLHIYSFISIHIKVNLWAHFLFYKMYCIVVVGKLINKKNEKEDNWA